MAGKFLSALSPGNGMAAYLRFSKNDFTKDSGNGVNSEGFVEIKFAELSDILYETNRKTSAFWTAGNRNAKGINKGVRLSTGKILVQTIEQDFISKLNANLSVENSLGSVNSIKKSFSFGIDKPITEKNPTELTKDTGSNFRYVDEIPLFDLIVVAKGDHATLIGTNAGISNSFDPECIYRLELHGVKMMTDIFAVGVGDTINNKVVDIMILKGIKNWEKV